jgi:hypothetical protein
MSAQLNLNFGGYDVPNANGVYADCERIVMPSKKANFRAEVRVAYTEAGFCWGSSGMVELHGFGGMPNVCDIDSGRVVPLRQQAIAKGAAEVYRHFRAGATAGERAVLAWVKTICPDLLNISQETPNEN